MVNDAPGRTDDLLCLHLPPYSLGNEFLWVVCKAITTALGVATSRIRSDELTFHGDLYTVLRGRYNANYILSEERH